jgi:hypothetical protein
MVGIKVLRRILIQEHRYSLFKWDAVFPGVLRRFAFIPYEANMCHNYIILLKALYVKAIVQVLTQQAAKRGKSSGGLGAGIETGLRGALVIGSELNLDPLVQDDGDWQQHRETVDAVARVFRESLGVPLVWSSCSSWYNS